MGEYAKRKKDGQEVKIGTCDDMMYCRYDQLSQVEYEGNTSNCYWRIPNPKEDDVEVGNFEPSVLKSGYDNKFKIVTNELALKPFSEYLEIELIQCRGTVQSVCEPLGMVINLPCYHGLKLPEGNDDIKCFWNGKRDVLHLHSLKNEEFELKVVFSCAACGKSWAMSLQEILPYVKSLWMKLRLLHQCTEYYLAHNDDVGSGCFCIIREKDIDGKDLEICYLNGWLVTVDDAPVKQGAWEDCRNEFIRRLPDVYDNKLRYGDEQTKHWEVMEMKVRYLDYGKESNNPKE